MGSYLFTSESVSAGHPDKVADRISDAILDEVLRRDPRGRAAIEVLVTKDLCVIAGETSEPGVDAKGIARRVIRDIGYDGDGFHPDIPITVALQPQSREIFDSVKHGGAGDQGLMFGFACDETDAYMPAPIYYAHRILERLAALRREFPGKLGPDAKSQVTLEYRDGRPVRVDTVVVSQQHAETFSRRELEELCRGVFREVFPAGWYHDCGPYLFEDRCTHVIVNPSGSFVHGGPAADTGLTGRKIVVDTYGGAAPHGGGAFSGKDPSKVDRSAAYAARWLAKNVVAAGLARRCLIQVSYAIGVREPLALCVDTSGTGVMPDGELAAALKKLVSLEPDAIRKRLGLDHPIYERTASYGHFGREPDATGGFAWEKLDLVDALLVLRR
jgi:S-adenosylmethionine synthetase